MRYIALLAAACVAGCGSHPIRKAEVQSPIQTEWEQVPKGVSQPDTAAAPAAWWQVFHDPVLDKLITLGLSNNLDLQQAQARIDQARAQRLGASANLWPNFTASAGDAFERSPLLQGLAPHDFTVALNASWNVDIFGQARNQLRAASATLRATQYDRDATKVNLASQIATQYLQYRLFRLQYAIATRSAESQAEVVRITRLRFEQGAASRLDLEQVASQLATTRAAVPQAFEQADAARNTLILLLASTPEAVDGDLPAAIADENPQLPNGDPLEVLLTPAQVIEQRPDIRAAEFRLVSAAANLKSALAQRYPQLTIGGMFGSAATDVGQLTTAGSKAYGYNYALTLPIFDFGRIRSSIDLADAEQHQAYLTYEQTVRGALQSTQTAIEMYAQGVLRKQQMDTALESARRASKLARTQYQAGALALLNVLIAEQAEYTTELTWSDAAAAVSQRLITLYQTMGVLPPVS
jgi:outer membrane protein, multidrug efflux system